ncbi:hypothetical protein D3C76_1309910 [compost metagenome]
MALNERVSCCNSFGTPCSLRRVDSVFGVITAACAAIRHSGCSPRRITQYPSNAIRINATATAATIRQR